MTATGIRMPIANIDGWLVTSVANPLRDAGGQPVSRATLERMTEFNVGATRDTDGYVVARANSRPDEEGPSLIVGESLRLLREQGWVTGPDEALQWCGPASTLTLQVGQRTITLMSEQERTADRRQGVTGRITQAQTDAVEVTVQLPRGGLEPRRLAIHPLALLIPGMTPADLERMYDDIETKGVNEPLVLFENKVLDGRHRLAIASLTGKPVKTRDYDGDETDARGYVWSANIARRHLSLPQLALAADRFGFIAGAKAEAQATQQAGRLAGGVTTARAFGSIEPEAVEGSRPSPTQSPPSPETNLATRPGATWQTLASRKIGGAVSPASLKRFDDNRVSSAPGVVARIDSGEIQRLSTAVEAAAAELGNVPTGPVPRSAWDRLGCAKGDIRAARDTLAEGPGAFAGNASEDQIRGRVTEIRALLDELEEVLGA